MEDKRKQLIPNDISPQTRFKFPDGSSLEVAVRPVEDGSLQYGVNLVYNSGRDPEPEISLWLPPHSIYVLVPVLQECANEARFIMGHKMLDYPSIPGSTKLKTKKKANRLVSDTGSKA